MTLSAPTKIVFLVSLVIAIVAVAAMLNVLAVFPFPAFWLMTAAYVVLAAGSLISGL